MRNVRPFLFLAWLVPAVTAQTRPATVNIHAIDDMELVAPAAGWTLADGHLFWTATEGEQWRELIPGQPSHIDGVFFLDTRRGWAVLSDGLQIDARLQISVASTQDGGTTWSLAPVQLTESRPYLRKAAVFFLDGDHGWLTLRLASSSNFSFGLMLSTTDGGKTWAQLPDPPAADPVYFASPSSGWIAGGPAGDELWATRNGGISWKLQVLSPPEACLSCKLTVQSPRFQSAISGVLPVTLSAGARILTATYRTSDAGTSWRPEGVLEQNGATHAGPSTIVDSHVLRAQVVQDTISVLSDAGPAVIAPIPAALPSAGSITRASFLRDNSGWIVYTSGTCAAFKAQCSVQSELLSAEKGGISFKIITPPGASFIERNSKPIGLAPTTSRSSKRVSADSSAEVSEEEGFDIACAPSDPDMLTWWQSSPYYDVGVYVGGDNVTCKRNTFLNSTWVGLTSGMGWGIIPLWVGLQSPCIANSNKYWTISETQPYQEGVSDADAAAEAAGPLGLGSSVIYFDMEYYPPGSTLKDGTACSPLVVQFLQGWADELHAQGYTAGLYGSLGDWWTTSGGAQDFIQLTAQIDAVWIAQDVTPPNDSVWNLGSLPNSYWSNNQRIHQYINGEASESWGGVTLYTIDRDVEDAPVVSWGGDRDVPAPGLLSPSNGALQVTSTPTFTWTAVMGATSGGGSGYRIMVATNPSILPTDPGTSSCPACTINYPPSSGPALMTNSYTPAAGLLQPGTAYWWQVQARPQTPKLGDWSPQFTFTTGLQATTIQSLGVQPPTIGSGSYALVTVTLNGLAAPGGIYVGLTTSNSAFPAPSYVKVPAGQSAVSVNILAGTVGATTAVTLTAKLNGKQSATVTIIPSSAVSTTAAATSITASSGVVNGTVNPEGDPGGAYFEWGTDPTLSSPTATCNYVYYYYNCPVATNSTAQSFSASLQGLSSGTVYYFRMVFYDGNNGAFTRAAIKSFKTLSPLATTTAATSITASSGVVNGTVNPEGDPGGAYFEWGTDPTLSSPTATCNYAYYSNCPVTANFTTQSFSSSLTGLASGAVYYYRMVFYDGNNAGFQRGAILNFTTQ